MDFNTKKMKIMKTSWKKEIPYLILVVIPSIYLALIYNSLPEQIPVHWNIEGEIDQWGHKATAWLVPILLPLLTYLLFLLIPIIDPKKKIAKMGSKYGQLKFLLVLFTTILAIYLIFAISRQDLFDSNFMFVLIGALFIGLGNYFQALKPNYFIGLRTPWTLENDTIWRKTHRLGGVVWILGGLVIIAASLLTGQDPGFFFYVFFSILTVMILIPVIYSYLLFRKIEN